MNTTTSVVMAIRLAKFWDEQAKWSDATFGEGRGPIGALKHLAKEVNETIDDPQCLEEYADMVHLLFDACRNAGFTLDQLVGECYRKLEINKKRKWNVATPGEPCEHIEE
jgi:dATP/dGTP diphosphohydrolase